MVALKRIAANTVEKRLRNEKGQPNFGINFTVLNAQGVFAAVTMHAGPSFAVCTEEDAQILKCEPLFTP